MARLKPFTVTLSAADSDHIRVVHLLALDVEHATEITQRQANDLAAQEAEAAGHGDQVGVREYVREHAYTVDQAVEG